MTKPIETEAGQAGDPDEYLGNAAIARLLGVVPDTWRTLVKDGHAPAPDIIEPLSRRRAWKRSTILAWYPTRPGRGFHETGAARAAKSHRWPSQPVERPAGPGRGFRSDLGSNGLKPLA